MYTFTKTQGKINDLNTKYDTIHFWKSYVG